MRVVVTGAAGFIGANMIQGLNAAGIDDIIAVDDLTDGPKFLNLRDGRISDYLDRRDFYASFAAGAFGRVEAVFHEGACSDTMEHDGRLMMDLNYRCSRNLLDACQAQGTRLLYASSAAVYGASTRFREEPENERPLNVYGYSKLLFDQVVRRMLPRAAAQVAGFRYFNVYGPREAHKGRMASVAFHHWGQISSGQPVRLFAGYDGYGAGEQSRDFVYVGDVVATKLWFFENPDRSGIFNLGTGRAQPFNDVATSTVNASRALRQQPSLDLAAQQAAGLIDYVEFPEALKGRYQSFTQADISALRAIGYDRPFHTVQEGVARYVGWLADADQAAS